VNFPDDESKLADRVKWIIDQCTASRNDRTELYNRRERYFLFGTDGSNQVRYNRLESHIDLVAAFLYAPDHAFYNIAAARNAADAVVKQAIALQDEWNDDFQDDGLSDLVAEAIPWSLVYDTMMVKQGWNDVREAQTCELIPPQNFGVFREDITDLDSQQAFSHTYFLDWSEAAQRVIRAGRGTELARIAVENKPFVSPFPDLLNRMIISATGGENLQGNIIGQVNPSYVPLATYQPKVDTPLVRFNELWAWDSDAEDYRIFHMVDPDILISDSKKTVSALLKAGRMTGKMKTDEKFSKSETNYFLPKDHPFTKVQPYTKYNYFWGKAHVDTLMPLQDWMTERLEQIADILERQAYPPKVGSGFMGLTDEKMDAFGGADTYLFDQMPQAKVEELRPEMPPDMFADFKEINGLFLEASGLTEVLQGRGDTGVRSRQHAQELKKTGGGRIKRAALKLEPSLVRIGDLGLKLKMKNDGNEIIPEPDDKGKSEPFVPAQIASEIHMRIEGHSHSPLFGDESKETAVLLKKADAIDAEMFVRMLNPPNRDAIIHSLRLKKIAAAKMAAEHPELAAQAAAGGKKRR
jgi:hypothetical protein